MLEGWTWLYVVGGVVVLVVVAVFAFRSRYSRVLADGHLDEVCETLDRIRVAACDHVGQPLPETPAAAAVDPRYAETSAGLRLAYTVGPAEGPAERAPGRLQHYLSMSHADRLPAESFARFVVGLAMVRCGRTPRDVAVARSRNLVTHLAFELDAGEHDEYAAAARESVAPGKAAIYALRRDWAQAGERVRIEPAGI